MKYSGASRTDREGVALVDLAVTGELGWIFREQPTSDYGIDAHIELVDDEGGVSGSLLALQIKSGASWLREPKSEGYVYRPDPAHVEYWLRHQLVVLVVLVDPMSRRCRWQQISRTTLQRSRTGNGWKLTVPNGQLIDRSARSSLARLAQTQSLRGQQQAAYAALLTHSLAADNAAQKAYLRTFAAQRDMVGAAEGLAELNANLLLINHDLQLIKLFSPPATIQLARNVNNSRYSVLFDVERIINIAKQLTHDEPYPDEGEDLPRKFQKDFNDARNVLAQFEASARIDLDGMRSPRPLDGAGASLASCRGLPTGEKAPDGPTFAGGPGVF